MAWLRHGMQKATRGCEPTVSTTLLPGVPICVAFLSKWNKSGTEGMLVLDRVEAKKLIIDLQNALDTFCPTDCKGSGTREVYCSACGQVHV